MNATKNPTRAGDTPPASEALDVLVVGGGPGGTAAAFRARELGLATLVIDHDDLMKRIRDYSKDKLILPSFGGGDKMRFPKGGGLISELCFSPIDKDDMCARWKGLYRQHGIPFRLGLELTGLERRSEGHWEAITWDHRAGREDRLSTRHVVLALGRGVPRRFDIPGNTDGITHHLADAQAFVGAPACVIGGGTSAAEAVIAISNAKATAQDPTPICWSYRGEKMPRVSKALADVFFEAYVGNGNIRYYPNSEPAAVVTGDDRLEYLAIRVDRRSIEGRPPEAVHLEFSKECCLACIGEDIPERLLGSLGIAMVQGGPRNKKRMVVRRHLESRQPNVYLVGDILSQAYFETDDFEADPASFREIKHRGNIKSALRDGVLVAEVIRQKLEGRTDIEVRVEDVEEPEEPAPRIAAIPRPAAGTVAASLEPDAGSETAESEAILIRVLPGGVQEGEHPVRSHGVTTIGRQDCDLVFASDTSLENRHASIAHGEDGYFLRDDGSASGVFLRVPTARKLEVGTGDLIRAGRQFLLFTQNNGRLGFTHFDAAGNEVAYHEIAEGTTVLGRQAPGITLDAGDKTLSRRQMAISLDGEKLRVKDLKSANGTYLRVRSATRIEHGDQIRVGQQLLTFSQRQEAALDEGHAVAPAAPAAAKPTASSVDQQAASTSGVTVRFRGAEKALAVVSGQTVCDVAEANGLEITAECHSGICGSDPIRILKGRENLDTEAGDQERETLEEICDLEPGECRLACMVRIRGPVEVEILKPR